MHTAQTSYFSTNVGEAGAVNIDMLGFTIKDTSVIIDHNKSTSRKRLAKLQSMIAQVIGTRFTVLRTRIGRATVQGTGCCNGRRIMRARSNFILSPNLPTGEHLLCAERLTLHTAQRPDKACQLRRRLVCSPFHCRCHPQSCAAVCHCQSPKCRYLSGR
jgi:hypothetical protein